MIIPLPEREAMMKNSSALFPILARFPSHVLLTLPIHHALISMIVVWSLVTLFRTMIKI